MTPKQRRINTIIKYIELVRDESLKEILLMIVSELEQEE